MATNNSSSSSPLNFGKRSIYKTREISQELKEKFGVFECITNGDWPTTFDCAHTIYLGLIGLQHR